MFEPHLIFISIICVSPKEANCCCLPRSLSISLHVGYKAACEEERVRVHDIDCRPKSKKLALLGKLVVQQYWYFH